ncbi:MAG: urocanate hydratase [Myxococcota bacterium]
MYRDLSFKNSILAGIPSSLPAPLVVDRSINHAPKRKDILNVKEKRLAIQNALRYFDPKHHAQLMPEFAQELKDFGRIYMHRFRPSYDMCARPLDEYPHQSRQAAAIMLMIQNNLDPKVAQHPHELITYGGNGGVFQNWAQYLLTMQYLATMTDEQTLVMYSGHPMGLFPSHAGAPRVVVTNGLMVPNYSKPDDLDRFTALGVTQYGQMTAGSFMYIGPQGIVHGTMLTLLNAGRKIGGDGIKVFVSSGLGGMSGAQGKAAVIAGAIAIIAEVNPKAIQKRHAQGWIDEIFSDLDALLARLKIAKADQKPISLGFQGNVIDLWEALAKHEIKIDLGSDQTSLHNPLAGGYYPADMSLETAQKMMAEDPENFEREVRNSLVRHANAIRKMTDQGMYFFDYGNAFLLEASRSGADIQLADGSFCYPSYVQDIMGPMCFDFGFGPFRWVCTSGRDEDLRQTDLIAAEVLESILRTAPAEISAQLQDNLTWIRQAEQNKLVVGSKARILYADAEGRMQIAQAFNQAIKDGRLSAPIVLGRDHHDVSGTDSPYRETSNIEDGSSFTADMAVQNFVGDAFRGATWVSLHNGGGVGFGEVMNGGFGLVLDGSDEADAKLRSMLFWDVNNGIARRSWARNPGARFAIERAMANEPLLRVTHANLVDEKLLGETYDKIFCDSALPLADGSNGW